ncbi:copper amine oxidase [Paenibacillus woosongensis]|uniref:Copper amine oxidase n=1 Tax=Paenibacillus woosongensis TaxID=307580 RepID=A0A7X3CNF6_9BACL|nr:copper amine oxidase [Paenibacillus woosongensis]MUG44940.1 copper amine oxidase [Paenibacillus woosongensis]
MPKSTLIVNGKTQEDKGAVIDGRTNAPVRALSDALGADIQVSGKTIYVTTDDAQPIVGSGSESIDNPYIGQPKASLEKIKAGLENDTLKLLKSERDEIKAGIDQLKASSGGELTQKTIESAEKNLATYKAADIQKYTKELELINEALQALEN